MGYDLEGASAPLADAGLIEARSVADFRPHLSPPRRIFRYIPAGPAVDSVLADLAPHLERGDVVVDGGNSYWGDSIRRHRRLREQGVHFVVSGRPSDGPQPSRAGSLCGHRRAVRR